mmetsp:Transcript_21662/g.33033  ORF Transcript_21662/g.33033 Transcript_21662/m.33033 type:complete len:94 (+) Transcript_21662:2532-2813(+)
MLFAVNTSALAMSMLEKPRIRHIIINPIDAVRHLYMFRAKADPPDAVHLTSHMKKPIVINNGARRAAMTPSAVGENTTTTMLDETPQLERNDV